MQGLPSIKRRILELVLLVGLPRDARPDEADVGPVAVRLLVLDSD